MTEQLLNGSDVIPCVEQMGGERVAQRVNARRFVDPGQPNRLLKGLLQAVLVEVMPPGDSGAGIFGKRRGRENILSSPFQVCGWIFPVEREGKVNAGDPRHSVILVDQFHPG